MVNTSCSTKTLPSFVREAKNWAIGRPGWRFLSLLGTERMARYDHRGHGKWEMRSTGGHNWVEGTWCGRDDGGPEHRVADSQGRFLWCSSERAHTSSPRSLVPVGRGQRDFSLFTRRLRPGAECQRERSSHQQQQCLALSNHIHIITNTSLPQWTVANVHYLSTPLILRLRRSWKRREGMTCILHLRLSLRSGIWKQWTSMMQLMSIGEMNSLISPHSNINILVDNHHPLLIIFMMGRQNNLIQFKNPLWVLLMIYCSVRILEHAQGVVLDKCTIIAASRDMVFIGMYK